ncbi:MAG TPA: LamG-like jellyroll fold domain-containing protein [Bryobacteraceae bacterium]|nr:LamG-like jellyroll fold domain-containing protein [Bryobacteraceae bacterium]
MKRLIALSLFAAPLLGGYAWQAQISIPAPAASHTDFTVPVCVTDAKLRPVASGGQIQHSVVRTYGGFSQTVPADFVISSDAAYTSLYNWGFKSWDQSTGKACFVFRVPSWTGSFTAYLSIGDPSITTYQGGSIGSEFDSHTKAFWHFGDGSSVMLADFSASALHATNSGATASTSSFDGGVSFGGSARASAGANKTALQPASVTLGCLAKLNSTSQGGFAWMVTQDYATPRSSPYAAYALMTNDSGSGVWSWWFDLGGGTNRITSASARDTSQHYVAGTVQSGAQALYIDSSTPAATGTVSGSLSYSSSGVFTFGGNSDGGENANVVLADCSVADVVRSGSWIGDTATLYLSPPTAGAFSALATSSFVAGPSVIVVP